MNPNALRQWMDFYDQQGMGGGRYADAGDGRMVPVRDDNRGGRRMMWAERMAGMDGQGSQAPNFFAEMNGPTYREPGRFSGQQPMQQPREQYDAEGMPEGRNYGAQADARQMHSMRPQTDNYLARLLGGR